MSEELKPCPFCGEKQKSISFLEITASLVIAVREQYFHVEE